jgi:type II secretory pathway pseudopilin PulG
VKTKQLKGFSLQEILVIISILLVLFISSVILIPKQIVKAKDAKIKTNLHQIYMALEDFYDSNNNFPETFPDCSQPLIENGHIFIPNIPCDPFDNSNYLYTSGSDDFGNWFKVYAKLRNLDDNIISLVGCEFGCGPNCEYNYGVSSTNTLIDRCPDPDPATLYACSPGVNKCEEYDDPDLSECPKVYPDDPTCNNECLNEEYRCKNASGKHQPE